MGAIVLPTPDNTVGAMFLGCTFSAICYGMTSLQVIVYYTSFPTDPKLHKIAAAVLWFLDTLHLILSIHFVYFYVIGQFGKTTIVVQIVWSSKLICIVNNLIVLSVQSLYAMRVWKISGYHSLILGYIAAVMILVGFAVGIVLAYQLYSVKTFIQLANITWAISASFSTVAAIDMIMAIATFICLHKSKSMLPNLQSKLTTIIVYTVVSGFVTSLFAVAALVAYLLMPYNLVFVAIGFVLTRLHVNSFLGLLNVRPRNSVERKEATSSSITLRSPVRYSHKRGGRASVRPGQWTANEASCQLEYSPTENTLSVSSRPNSFKDCTPLSSVCRDGHVSGDMIPRAI